MKLSVAIICKNEESCIKDCLESVKDADEICVTDTGSTDKTLEIVKQYTDKISYFKWCDDFSKARNFCKKQCSGDWILSIDADEVLLSSIKEIKDILTAATTEKSFNVKMRPINGHKTYHFPVRIFKNIPEVKWQGVIHEAISPAEKHQTNIEIAYGYSEAHQQDPDRTLRILQKSVKEHPKSARNLFYLGREYVTRKEYEKAIPLLLDCVKYTKWLAEKAEARLLLCRCYWETEQGDKARECAYIVTQINPDIREAWLFLADSHNQPWKEKYLQFAELATNKNVIFERCPKVIESKIPKMLHHIWVGSKPAPMEWIQTWYDKHPDWEHILWDNDKVFGRKWINQRLVDEYRKQECWHGVADVVRYEILYEYGGLMPGADSICLNNTDELWEDGFEAYAVYENEKVRPGLITPLYASSQKGRTAKILMEGLKDKKATEPWLTTGNMYMKEVYEKQMPPMKVFPSYYFNPKHYTGETYQGTGKVYAEQKWSTTFNKYINKSVALITTAFNGYDKFIPEWKERITLLNPKPNEIILVSDKQIDDLPDGVKFVLTKEKTMGGVLNDGIKIAKSDVVFHLPVDDEPFSTLISEIKGIDADVILLRYMWGQLLCQTPPLKKELIKDWKEHYTCASGYFAFKRQLVEPIDFWKWPFLFRALYEDKTIKETINPCMRWFKRPDSHGNGDNVERGEQVIGEYAKKYL